MILRRKKLIESFTIFVALVAIFWPIITFERFPLLKYLDEIMALCGIIYIIKNNRHLDENIYGIVYLLLGLTTVGLIGTFINQLQTRTFAVLLDVLAFWKVFLVFIWGNAIVGGLSEKSKKYVVRIVNYILVPWIIVAFVLAVVNVFVDIGFSDEIRFGRRCFSFFYPKSSTFGNLFYVIILLIVLNYYYYPKRKNFLYLVLALIVWFLTLRSRAVLFVLVFIGMYYWIVYKRNKIKSKFLPMLILVLFSFFIVGEKIDDTYSSDTAPRALLLQYGIKTMQTYMPIGAGFGTYGTDVACTYYSILYTKYGFEYVYGLNPYDTQYAHDTYWPAVMGEMGVVGVFLMIGVLVFWIRIVNGYSTFRLKYMMCLFLIATQLMASLPTSVFFQNNTAFLFLLLPLLKDTRS